MCLKNKRILITAGPTWVPIDKVRVISNIATGQTGILLAEKLQRLGAKVTLLLGPAETYYLNKNIKLMRFKFFDELKNKLLKELKTKKYDILIHSVAVSDYKPAKVYRQKVESGIKNLTLKLTPTVKIIDLIRKANPDIFLVGFKYEPDADKNLLIKETNKLIQRSKLNLTVANSIIGGRYKAYIINKDTHCGPFLNKNAMCDNLIKILQA